VFHPDDLRKTLDSWQRALETGEGYDIEVRLRRHDGVYRWHVNRAVPVRDADGRVIKWFGTCTDIDDQKRTEEELRQSREALRASEAFYRQVLDAVADGVWTAGPDGRLDSVNRWARDHLGICPEQGLGDAWQNTVHPDDFPEARERWTQARQKGDECDIEFRVRRQDGFCRRIRCRTVPARDGSSSGSAQPRTSRIRSIPSRGDPDLKFRTSTHAVRIPERGLP
jgi:PAS domain S-box-containing protein